MTQTELFPQRAIEHNAYVPPMAKNPDSCYGVIYMAVTPSRNVYIGQATNLARRKIVHNYDARHGKKTSFAKALRKYGNEVEWRVIWYCDSEEALNEAEIFFIAYYRKYIKHPYRCYNHTTGGGSGKRDAETCAKIGDSKRGIKLSPEHCAKLRNVWLGRKHSPETKAKMSLAQKGHKVSAETRTKIGMKSKGRRHTAEERAKQSAAQKGRKMSAEACANLSAALKGRKFTLEHRAKIAAARRGRSLSPEHRAKIGLAHKGRKQSPELVAKRMAGRRARLKPFQTTLL